MGLESGRVWRRCGLYDDGTVRGIDIFEDDGERV